VLKEKLKDENFERLK